MKVLCGLALLLPLAAAIPQPVKTDLGSASGVPSSDGAVVAFKGLPFAAPPVGPNRWRAPKAATPWPGVRKADRYSASRIQNMVTERKPWTYEFMAQPVRAQARTTMEVRDKYAPKPLPDGAKCEFFSRYLAWQLPRVSQR